MEEKKTTGILGSTLKQTFKQIKDSRNLFRQTLRIIQPRTK